MYMSFGFLFEADKPCQFFSAVVGKSMCKYLQNMKFSTMFLLACGSVVQVKSAQDGLKRIIME